MMGNAVQRGTESAGLFPKYIVLTVAGSDSGAGDGIQADLKTILAFGGYGVFVITALTAQNTLGVSGTMPVPGPFIQKQMEAVFSDLPPAAVKIGMLPNAEAVEAVSSVLQKQKESYRARGKDLPIVLDPVMVSTSGTPLLEPEALSCLREHLFPLCSLLTPNLPEAQALLECSIKSSSQMEDAAEEIARRFGCSVLLKGGHSDTFSQEAADCLHIGETGKTIWVSSPRLDCRNTHGTGCTLSSAIACGLAQNFSMEESVRKGKNYLEKALRNGLDLGQGNGPLNHGCCLQNTLLL